MSVDATALGIERLSVGERLDLIDQIWDSLPAEVAPSDVPTWHLPELAKRREAIQADPAGGTPWREALDQLGAQS